MNYSRRKIALAAAMGMLSVSAISQPATYPSKPVTFLVPFAAGSATDQLARAIGVAFSEATKQAVVVDNRGGASGIIAAQAAARAAPDGYTVMITTNTTQAANLHLYKKLPYDAVKDFQPVTALGRGGQILVVKASSPHNTVSDLIAAAKKDPGKLTFGAGNSSSRVAGEMFKQLSNTDVLYVPYKSNPTAVTDLLGGQIDFMVADTITGIPQIEAGKLKPLGVSTARRLPVLPNVPTLDEAGVKGYDIGYWFAAYVPAGTPMPITNKLRELLHTAVKSTRAKAFYYTSATEAWTTTSQELGQFQAAEAQKWGKVIRAANIEPE